MLLKDKIIKVLSVASLIVLVQLSFLGIQLLLVDIPNISKQHIKNLHEVHDKAQSIIDKLGQNNLELQKAVQARDTEISALKDQVTKLNSANVIAFGEAQQAINQANTKLKQVVDAANKLADFVEKNMMLSSQCVVVRDPPCMNAEESGNDDACGF